MEGTVTEAEVIKALQEKRQRLRGELLKVDAALEAFGESVEKTVTLKESPNEYKSTMTWEQKFWCVLNNLQSATIDEMADWIFARDTGTQKHVIKARMGYCAWSLKRAGKITGDNKGGKVVTYSKI